MFRPSSPFFDGSGFLPRITRVLKIAPANIPIIHPLVPIRKSAMNMEVEIVTVLMAIPERLPLMLASVGLVAASTTTSVMM